MNSVFPLDPFASLARQATTAVPNWRHSIFATRSATEGGIIGRAVRDEEREVGREVFMAEVRRRQFHLVECGGPFIVICNPGHMRVRC